MVKDLKYIIKRIIIGIGVAFAIMTLKGHFLLQAHALEVYSYNSGGGVDVINNTQWLTYYDLDNHWSDWGTGYIRFNFTVQKTAQATPSGTTPVVTPRAVYVSTGNADFICDIGSIYTQNSTYNAQVYSAMCPVSFYGGNGLRRVNIYFQDMQFNVVGEAKVSFDGHVTFEKPGDNFDVSGVVSGANQNTQNIINNNNSNTQSIINNQNSNKQDIINNQNNNTQAIVDSQQDINNSLNDTSGGEVSSSWFDEFKDSSTTPVSDLLTMPITLLQAYLNGFSANCQAMNLGNLYGTYIIIPCLNIESYLGSELWSLIDVLFTLFMLYNIGMLCVTIYEGITSLDDDMQMLYSPQHAGAGDTRVERYGDNY